MLMSRFTTVQAIPINHASMEMFLTGAQSEFFGVILNMHNVTFKLKET